MAEALLEIVVALTSFLALVLRSRELYGLPFEILVAETNNREFIVIGRKCSTSEAPRSASIRSRSPSA
jgi:hypothetical protein